MDLTKLGAREAAALIAEGRLTAVRLPARGQDLLLGGANGFLGARDIARHHLGGPRLRRLPLSFRGGHSQYSSFSRKSGGGYTTAKG